MTLRLICSDLDGTLIPSGYCAESHRALRTFARLISKHEIQLAYVSGRDHRLVQQVIDEYQLPAPDYVISDVGSSIYACHEHNWTLIQDWHHHIGPDWGGRDALDIAAFFAEAPGLILQEDAHQGRYKLSFYAPLEVDQSALMWHVQELAGEHQLAVSLIYSVDHGKHIGLLDILPAAANKLAAIRYLMNLLRLDTDEVLFAGDSGNDMDVLSSELPAVLVANAHDSVRRQALRMARQAGYCGQLYVARGVSGDGRYANGVIEGIQFYFPDLKEAV